MRAVFRNLMWCPDPSLGIRIFAVKEFIILLPRSFRWMLWLSSLQRREPEIWRMGFTCDEKIHVNIENERNERWISPFDFGSSSYQSKPTKPSSTKPRLRNADAPTNAMCPWSRKKNMTSCNSIPSKKEHKGPRLHVVSQCVSKKRHNVKLVKIVPAAVNNWNIIDSYLTEGFVTSR